MLWGIQNQLRFFCTGYLGQLVPQHDVHHLTFKKVVRSKPERVKRLLMLCRSSLSDNLRLYHTLSSYHKYGSNRKKYGRKFKKKFIGLRDCLTQIRLKKMVTDFGCSRTCIFRKYQIGCQSSLYQLFSKCDLNS
jgi:hypothetical protein